MPLTMTNHRVAAPGTLEHNVASALVMLGAVVVSTMAYSLLLQQQQQQQPPTKSKKDDTNTKAPPESMSRSLPDFEKYAEIPNNNDEFETTSSPDPTTAAANEQQSEADADAEFEQHLMRALIAPQQEDMDALFVEIDANEDGKLSLVEVEKAIFCRKHQYDLKPGIVLRAFDAADSNNDGYIDRTEFFQFLRMITYFKNLRLVFELMDTNHDQRVSRDEFMRASRILELDDVDNVWDDMSQDHHGQYIVFDEFCLWMAQKKA